MITIFTFKEEKSVEEICRILNKRTSGCWITAKKSKYNENEIFISYWYYEDVEECLKKMVCEEVGEEIASFLKENGKNKVLRRVYCFINTKTKTLEIYRGPDEKTEEIVSSFERELNINFNSLTLSSEELKKIFFEHGLELKQAMFKNVEGMIYEIMRANRLEENNKFKEYLKKFPDSLRVISFRPKIRFLNSNNKYQVTINGDKGTIKLSTGNFSWRPRYEVRQIVFILASKSGLMY